MALVMLLIQDEEDGSVSVRLHSEPQAARIERADFTAAQHLGATALNAISNEMETNPQAGKKLKLVVASEIPH